MTLKQLKCWTRAKPKTEPVCIIIAYAANVQYSINVEVRNQLEPLRDNASHEVLHYDSVDQAKIVLKKIGLTSAGLRMLDPYCECGPAGQIVSDMPLIL